MEQVKGWRTSDNKVIENKKEAQEHEIYLKCHSLFAETDLANEEDVVKRVYNIIDAVKTIKARGCSQE